MKTILTASLGLAMALALTYCSSSSDPNPGNNPNTGGDITISSISPETFYADDELTITGTGFSTDVTKITVQMGTANNGVFDSFDKTFDSDPAFTIVSATATKIVAKALETKTIDFEIYYDGAYAVQVTSDGKTALGAIKHSKHLVVFNLNASDAVNQVTGCFQYLQAGDSVHMTGLGFYGSCKVSTDGKEIPGVVTAKDNLLKFKIPNTQFGTGEDNCVEKVVKFKVTNGDGKSLEKEYHVATSPPMVVEGASFDKPSYTAGDAFANLTITGYCLYSTTMLRITGPNGYDQVGGIGVSGFPSVAVVPYTLGSLEAGNYSVRLKKNMSSEYGLTIASFTLSK